MTHIKNKLFSNRQFGFISGQSTVLQMIKFWTNGQTTDVIYCNLKKALDRVPQKRFLTKIQNYEINGNIL